MESLTSKEPDEDHLFAYLGKDTGRKIFIAPPPCQLRTDLCSQILLRRNSFWRPAEISRKHKETETQLNASNQTIIPNLTELINWSVRRKTAKSLFVIFLS